MGKFFKANEDLEKILDRKEWNKFRKMVGDAGQELAKASDFAREARNNSTKEQ